jgi:hypothetical protein
MAVLSALYYISRKYGGQFMESKPINSPPLRVAGYRRVSMRDQVDNFSLDAQENSIRQYVEKHGWQTGRDVC